MLLGTDYMRYIFGKVEIDTIQKRLEGKKLKQTERNYLSRSIRPKLLAAKIVTEKNIFEKIKSLNVSSDKKLIFNLSRYGYDILTLKKIKKQEHLILEDLIALIIIKNPKPRFIEAIPILLLKNKIDKFKLAELGFKYNICSQLGYLLEITLFLGNIFNIKKDLYDLLEYFKKNKEKNIKNLAGKKDDDYDAFLIDTSPKRIKNWNLLGRFYDEDFIKIAEASL